MATWRSKLGNVYAKDLVDSLDAQHHHILKRIRAEPGNSHCAECGTQENTWAVVNHGVFVCTRCADVHRHLGTHISKPKGCGGTYLWGPDEIEQMRSIGNRRAAALYCGRGAPQMSVGASKEELVDFCTKKYSKRLWAQVETGTPTQWTSDTSAPIRQTDHKPLSSLGPRQPTAKLQVRDRELQTLFGENNMGVRGCTDLIDFEVIFADFADFGGDNTHDAPTTNARATEPVPEAHSEISFIHGCFVQDASGHVAAAASTTCTLTPWDHISVAPVAQCEATKPLPSTFTSSMNLPRAVAASQPQACAWTAWDSANAAPPAVQSVGAEPASFAQRTEDHDFFASWGL